MHFTNILLVLYFCLLQVSGVHVNYSGMIHLIFLLSKIIISFWKESAFLTILTSLSFKCSSITVRGTIHE